MPSNTANYNLTLYDRTADENQQFFQFREDIAGTIAASNMNKIDNQMKINADTINELAGVGRTTETVKQNADNIEQLNDGVFHEVTTIGTDTYGGTSVSISSYFNGQKILLKPANNNTGNSTLNINELGAKSLRKIVNGSEVELNGGDLKQNHPQLFEYNGTCWIAISNLSIGDMFSNVYDPTNVQDNAFNMDNMIETATSKIMTSAERIKLENVEDNANSYIHPASHSPNIITQDTNNRFVTDSEKATWNNKFDATAKAVDSDKLDGIDSSGFIRANADDSVTAHTEWQDSKEVRFGNDADMRILHNGTDNLIRLYNANLNIQKDNSETIAKFNRDGAVELYFNNEKRFETTNTGIKIYDIDFHKDTIDPSGTTRLNMDGYLYATRVYNAVYNDLAEFMEYNKEENPTPGDVMVMTEKGLELSKNNNDKRVVGVYSDTYGFALGAENEDDTKIPIGISGRVLVKIEDNQNPQIGDLVVSSENGKGYINNEPKVGTVIGKIYDGNKLKDNKYWIVIMLS